MKRLLFVTLTVLLLLSQLAWAKHITADHDDLTDSCELCLKIQSHDTIVAKAVVFERINYAPGNCETTAEATSNFLHKQNIRAPPAFS